MLGTYADIVNRAVKTAKQFPTATITEPVLLCCKNAACLR
jgi:hypothetical protein